MAAESPSIRILIATPAFDRTVTLEYFSSITQLLRSFSRKHPDIDFAIRTISMSVIHDARNFFASVMLATPGITHLLFVDADMGFQPKLIEKMIGINRPIVAAAYPTRRLNESKYLQTAKSVSDPEKAISLSAEFVAADSIFPGQGTGEGFLRAASAGTGVMLIQRHVFEMMQQKFASLWVANGSKAFRELGHSGGVFQCFAPLPNEEGLLLSEDRSFCRRWVEGCGGEIWVCVDEPVTHVGRMAFRARMSDQW